jgi:hypothetical protein
MGHDGSRSRRRRRVFAALLVSLILIAGCGEPARKPSHYLGPRFAPRALCQEAPTSNSPAHPFPCVRHGGDWEWLRALPTVPRS